MPSHDPSFPGVVADPGGNSEAVTPNISRTFVFDVFPFQVDYVTYAF